MPYRQAGQRRNAEPHGRAFGVTHREHDNREQQHQSDLEEHRNADDADDAGDQRRLPRQRRRATLQQRVDDLLCTAGIRQQFAEHGAERDQHADLAEYPADTGFIESGDFVEWQAGAGAH